MNKPILTFSLFILLSAWVQGQEQNEGNTTLNNEFSIFVDDIFAKAGTVSMPVSFRTSNVIYIDYNLASLVPTKVGLGYKRHFTNSAIRSKIAAGYKNYEYNDTGREGKEEGSYFSTNLAIGIEMQKTMNKTQFYYGFDVIFDYYYTISSFINIEAYPIIERDNEYNIIRTGGAPLIGIKYFLSPQLSISTELKYIVESYKIQGNYDDSGITEKTDVKGIDTRFGPLGHLSINIHF